jgi:carbon monoxide dehydrogenase subunit G
LAHEFTVPAPVEVVWSALLDPERVAPCMPGATLTEVDGTGFSGTVKVKLGPISLLYKGTGEFVEIDEQARVAVLKASGKDTRGNGTASATVTVTLSESDGATAAAVITDFTITGRPAQFGRGLIGEVGGKLISQFADCLATTLGTEEAVDDQDDIPPAGGAEVTAQPHLRAVPDPPEAEPIDLLQTAGVPTLKRFLPLLLGLVVLVVLLRRRRHR